MRQLEVFFDYACPFCLRGHNYLTELLPQHTDIEVVWRPCEAHPRPDPYGPHSDLCIQGMFFMQEQGGDLNAYHDRMYQAALTDRIDIEDIGALTAAVAGLADADAFRKALESGQYREVQLEANRYAFEQSGVWAVPSYRMDGKKLDSVENIGVTKEQLALFLR